MKAAKSVVEIWQWGGPSQLETFDPKPEASRDFNGGLKAIPTNVPGMSIHEWWPELAKCADLYSVIRTMTHTQFGHESAAYLMQTGRLPGGGDIVGTACEGGCGGYVRQTCKQSPDGEAAELRQSPFGCNKN